MSVTFSSADHRVRRPAAQSETALSIYGAGTKLSVRSPLGGVPTVLCAKSLCRSGKTSLHDQATPSGRSRPRSGPRRDDSPAPGDRSPPCCMASAPRHRSWASGGPSASAAPQRPPVAVRWPFAAGPPRQTPPVNPRITDEKRCSRVRVDETTACAGTAGVRDPDRFRRRPAKYDASSRTKAVVCGDRSDMPGWDDTQVFADRRFVPVPDAKQSPKNST
jgi:hypothetical protein